MKSTLERIARLTAASLSLVSAASGQSASECFYEEQVIVPVPPATRIGFLPQLSGDTLLTLSSQQNSVMDLNFYRLGVQGWTLEQNLAPPPFGLEFGQDLALSGDTAVVTDWMGNDNGFGPTGEAHVYERAGTNWSKTQSLVGSGLQEWSFFGASVDLLGDTMVVGADWARKVFVFERSGGGPWAEVGVIYEPAAGLFGNNVAIDGTPGAYSLAIADTQGQGRVYVYTGSGSSWTLEDSFVNPMPLGTDLRFGAVMDLRGDLLLTGTRQNGPNGTAELFRRIAGQWSLVEQWAYPGVGTGSAYYGIDVGLGDGFAIVAASGATGSAGVGQGAAYLYREVGNAWEAAGQLVPSTTGAAQNFGWHAIDGETVVATGGDRGFAFRRKREAGTPRCFCAIGPCGNSSSASGCTNSSGQGAGLVGRAGLGLSDLDLQVDHSAPHQYGIFFQGDNAIQLPFGDGNLCTGLNQVRISSPLLSSNLGSVGFGPCQGDPPIHTLTGITIGSGVSKHYQFWYRDPNGPCGSGFNTSNAVRIDW